MTQSTTETSLEKKKKLEKPKRKRARLQEKETSESLQSVACATVSADGNRACEHEDAVPVERKIFRIARGMAKVPRASEVHL
jgi:hypothetical protein